MKSLYEYFSELWSDRQGRQMLAGIGGAVAVALVVGLCIQSLLKPSAGGPADKDRPDLSSQQPSAMAAESIPVRQNDPSEQEAIEHLTSAALDHGKDVLERVLESRNHGNGAVAPLKSASFSRGPALAKPTSVAFPNKVSGTTIAPAMKWQSPAAGFVPRVRPPTAALPAAKSPLLRFFRKW